MSNGTILIVEPDESLRQLFDAALSDFSRFQVADGEAVHEAVLKHRPEAILIETQLPDIPGLEVFRRIREVPRMAHIPFIFMGSGTELLLKNKILEAGAYDFVQKPLDMVELALRLQTAIERTRNEGLFHPQTRLPTGDYIGEQLANLPEDFYLIELWIEGFQSFRDVYGFVSAADVVRYVGNVMADVVLEYGAPNDFIGHYGDDKFIILTNSQVGPRLYGRLKKRLDSQLPQFYTFTDREQGYIELESGSAPLMRLKADIAQQS
jgi:CheY-like chemotaxis protein